MSGNTTLPAIVKVVATSPTTVDVTFEDETTRSMAISDFTVYEGDHSYETIDPGFEGCDLDAMFSHMSEQTQAESDKCAEAFPDETEGAVAEEEEEAAPEAEADAEAEAEEVVEGEAEEVKEDGVEKEEVEEEEGGGKGKEKTKKSSLPPKKRGRKKGSKNGQTKKPLKKRVPSLREVPPRGCQTKTGWRYVVELK